MIPSTYDIAARVKSTPIAIAARDDFHLTPAPTSSDARALLARPSVTPYCIDPISGDVLLVETPDDLDLTSMPFVYEAQYRYATRIHALPMESLVTIAEEMPPPPVALLIHSTGRCGSTLLARALRSLDVTTWSEPDVFSQLAMLGRPENKEAVAAIRSLYGAFLRIFTRGHTAPVAFKLRSLSCEHAAYIASAAPSSRSLFLYREATAVARSYARLTGRPLATWVLSDDERQAWSVIAPILREREGPVDGYDLMAMLWAGPVRHYLDEGRAAHWLGALDYDDFVRHPQDSLAMVLTAIGAPGEIPPLPDHVLARHSQSDSHLSPEASKKRMDEDPDIASPHFAAIIARRLSAIDERLSPNMELPTRLRVGHSNQECA
ncbi:hypothetical protein QE385_003901 [Sphingomonas sp. SORGH_AS 950]|uniref:hypothetical protein n=1 Tax=Sphingomonas sp. SORGH_AS_0950 TaxID=3041792 RepID=UPI0027801E09|nr:hypothetical protein [Sphingomonas sp. SORGH_AS_0950]MDQ1159504.1 hypothetical protein [Sphingomonas sp. SORGH_AS_0950]